MIDLVSTITIVIKAFQLKVFISHIDFTLDYFFEMQQPLYPSLLLHNSFNYPGMIEMSYLHPLCMTTLLSVQASNYVTIDVTVRRHSVAKVQDNIAQVTSVFLKKYSQHSWSRYTNF